jgi:hypothetical protein
MTAQAPGATNALNDRLARFVSVGCWLSLALMSAGMTLDKLGASVPAIGAQLLLMGIVLMITLPVLCVAMLGAWSSLLVISL